VNLLKKAVLYVARAVGLTDPRLYQYIGARHSETGETVTASSVLGLSAAWACVNLVAGSVGSLPLMVYRTTGDTREVARNHRLYRILHDSPNADQTSLEFWEFIAASLELQGAGFSEKELNSAGQLVALHPPITPELMKVERQANGSYQYRWTDQFGKARVVGEDRMLHIRGFGGGLSTLAFGRQTFGIAQALERTTARTFANGTNYTGIFKVKESLDATQRAQLENLLQGKFVASLRDGVPMVLDRDAEWLSLSMSAEDAQMLESRGFSVEEVCRFFGVPPIMIGHGEKTSSWGTGIAEVTQGFVKYTLRKRLKRIEQALEKQLLTVADRVAGITIEFNLEGLLRGDSKARAEFYQYALQNGWMTINEVRRLENLPPVPGGDTPRMQSQNVPISGPRTVSDSQSEDEQV